MGRFTRGGSGTHKLIVTAILLGLISLLTLQGRIFNCLLFSQQNSTDTNPQNVENSEIEVSNCSPKNSKPSYHLKQAKSGPKSSFHSDHLEQAEISIGL